MTTVLQQQQNGENELPAEYRQLVTDLTAEGVNSAASWCQSNVGTVASQGLFSLLVLELAPRMVELIQSSASDPTVDRARLFELARNVGVATAQVIFPSGRGAN